MALNFGRTSTGTRCSHIQTRPFEPLSVFQQSLLPLMSHVSRHDNCRWIWC